MTNLNVKTLDVHELKNKMEKIGSTPIKGAF